MQYIDMNVSVSNGNSSTGATVAKGDPACSKQGVAQQQGQQGVGDVSASSSLHVTVGSEVGDLADPVSMLGGDGSVPGNENGGQSDDEHRGFTLKTGCMMIFV